MSSGLRRRRTRFVPVPTTTIRDRRISFKARGILAFLLDHPDGWNVKADYIAANSDKDGPDAVYTALKELGRVGYYRVERRRLLNGTFTTGAAVSETPVAQWAEEYAEFGEKPVLVVEQRDGGFLVQHPDGRLTGDGFDSHELAPEASAPGPGFPDPVNPGPEPGLENPDPVPDRGNPGPVDPGPVEPDPGNPDSYTESRTQTEEPPPPPAPDASPRHAQATEEEDPPPEEPEQPHPLITEAAALLASLPHPWAIGRRQQQRLAPRVAEVLREWYPDDLYGYLTRNPHNVQNPFVLLGSKLDAGNLPTPPAKRPNRADMMASAAQRQAERTAAAETAAAAAAAIAACPLGCAERDGRGVHTSAKCSHNPDQEQRRLTALAAARAAGRNGLTAAQRIEVAEQHLAGRAG